MTSSDILKKAQDATAARKPRQQGEAWMFSIRDEIAELLQGSPFEVDSYLQSAWREIEKSDLLMKAAQDPKGSSTVLGAVMLGATLQLPIGGPLGQFYLTPRGYKAQGGGWGNLCVPMVGYRGFFELGYRSGNVSSYDYRIVRSGDTFKEYANAVKGNWFEWEGMPDGDDDRDLTHVIAMARLTNGDIAFKTLSKFLMDRRKPKKTENTPWEGPHAEAMYVKTAHRELAKFQQLTITQAKAVEADEVISMWNRSTEALETVRDETRILSSGQDQTEPASAAPNTAAGSPSAAPQSQARKSAPSAAKDPNEMDAEEFEAYSAAQYAAESAAENGL